MNTQIEIRETLYKTCKGLCLDEPFYGLFLIMLNKKWDENIGTAGVSKNGINYQMRICPSFWGYLTPLWRKGVLKHDLNGLRA